MLDFWPLLPVLVFVAVYLIGALWVERRFDSVFPIYVAPAAGNATPTIQRALDRAGKGPHGVVYLRSGIYDIEGTITIPPHTTLSGSQ